MQCNHVSLLSTKMYLQDVRNITDVFIELTKCRIGGGLLCWILVGFGCVTMLLLVIILVLCIVITRLLTRGKRYQYTPNVVQTQSSTDQNQIQEEQPPLQSQNQGKITTIIPKLSACRYYSE